MSGPEGPSPLLGVNEVTVQHGNVVAVRSATLQVPDGKIVAIVGSNGAGKTSLLESIAGLNRPSSGQIWLGGTRLDTLRPEQIVRLGVSLCPEGRRLIPRMTGIENLRIAWEGSDHGRRSSRSFSGMVEEAAALLPDVKPCLPRRAGQLSGGQAQLVAIARAWMTNPRMLLLDEPTLGLAPGNADRIMEVVLSLRSAGVSILLVEENVDLALAVSDLIYVMSSGKIVTQLVGGVKSALDEIVKRMVFGLEDEVSGRTSQ